MNKENETNFVIEIEQEVLGSLLLGADFRRISNILNAGHFIEPIHGVIFEAISDSYGRFNSTLPAVINKVIPDDAKEGYKKATGKELLTYLISLSSGAVFGAPSIENTAKRVVEQWAKHELIKHANALIDKATNPITSPDDIVRDTGLAFDDVMSNIRSGAKKRSQISIVDAANNAFQAAEEARKNGSGITGLSWGLIDVNRVTGGIHKRDLTLIGGRPSMGKTLTGLSTCLKVAAAGHGAGFISLEMDADKLAARAVTDIAFDQGLKVPYQELITGQVDEESIKKLRTANEKLHDMPLIIEEQSGLTLGDIRIKLEIMMQTMEKMGKPLELLMIDHLGLIKASNRYAGNRNNEIAEMTSGLKSLAREYDIAVVLLSQLNRSLEQQADKRPMLSSLRDSGAIEQDADTIILLYRESYYLGREKTDDPSKQAEIAAKLLDCENKLEFSIAKQRNGPVTSVDLFVDIACSSVRNWGYY